MNDNPAGRLLELFLRLGEYESSRSVQEAWAGVLGVDTDEVPLYLGDIGRLVSEIQRTAEATDPESLMPTVERYRSEWWKPVFPIQQRLNVPLENAFPEQDSINALRMVSANLHLAASEGEIPEDDQLRELTGTLQEALAAVREADDLPDPVRHAILNRLGDIQRALDHIKIGGPEAVKQAMDALIGAIATRTPDEARKSSVFKKVGKFFGLAWLIFMAGPNVDRALEAWGDHLPAQLTQEAEKVIEGKGKELPQADKAAPRHPTADGADPAADESPRK